MNNRDFVEGFLFGIHVCKATTGQNMNFDKMVEMLFNIAANQISLQPSPQESIEQLEVEIGKEMPDSLKQMIHQLSSGEIRQKSDQIARKNALLVLGEMGFSVS